MDCTLPALVNGGTTLVTGLNHLEGEEVQVLVGDAVFPNQTVSSGSITVTLPANAAYKTIEIGLGYVSTIKTLKVAEELPNYKNYIRVDTVISA